MVKDLEEKAQEELEKFRNSGVSVKQYSTTKGFKILLASEERKGVARDKMVGFFDFQGIPLNLVLIGIHSHNLTLVFASKTF